MSRLTLDKATCAAARVGDVQLQREVLPRHTVDLVQGRCFTRAWFWKVQGKMLIVRYLSFPARHCSFREPCAHAFDVAHLLVEVLCQGNPHADKDLTSIGLSPTTRDSTWLSTLLSESASNTEIQIVSPKMVSTARVFANFAGICAEECLWRLAQNLADVVLGGHPNMNVRPQRLIDVFAR